MRPRYSERGVIKQVVGRHQPIKLSELFYLTHFYRAMKGHSSTSGLLKFLLRHPELCTVLPGYIVVLNDYIPKLNGKSLDVNCINKYDKINNKYGVNMFDFKKALRKGMFAKNIEYYKDISAGVGVSQVSLSRYIHGKVTPSTNMIERFADFFGVPMNDFITWGTDNHDS